MTHIEVSVNGAFLTELCTLGFYSHNPPPDSEGHMQLFPQLSGQSFGKTLIGELRDPAWSRIDVAVAWIRLSGLMQLQEALSNALNRKAHVSVIVGIDKENTSEEGLEGLLELAGSAKTGKLSAFVRHNEAGPIFHPKLYCFRNASDVRAYIGSNNLTQAGLFQNEELSVRISDKIGSSLEKSLNDYLKSLRDQSSGLVLPLDLSLLKKLVAHGYVKKEAALRATLKSRARSARKKTALFAFKSVSAPPIVKTKSQPIKAQVSEPSISVNSDWPAISLRLRLARGTQAQIPIAVAREIRRRMGLTPIDGSIPMTSRADGSQHFINPARARGQVNTYKFEAGQVKAEPLLRIYPVENELFFEFLDSNDNLGKKVFKLLEDGFNADPPLTFSTTSNKDVATWYRFD